MPGVKKNHDVVSVTTRLIWETERAILVADENDEKVWLPKTAVDNLESFQKFPYTYVTFETDVNFAELKGLLYEAS